MDKRQVVLVVGSNRTGTSLLTEVLIEQGFKVPKYSRSAESDYDTYECNEFKRLSRDWNQGDAEDLVRRLPTGRIVLKYPKASRVLRRWLELIPDARVIYVFRPREEAVESQLKNWWRDRPCRWLARWNYRWEWFRGYLAVSNLSVPVCFVTFEELKRTRSFDIPASFEWSD